MFVCDGLSLLPQPPSWRHGAPDHQGSVDSTVQSIPVGSAAWPCLGQCLYAPLAASLAGRLSWLCQQL